jgi:hypothetical protein
MRRVRRTAENHVAIASAIALVAVACGCSYDPHPADGKVGCSAKGECPQGYTCDPTSETCFSGTNGGGIGSGGTSGNSGTGGATISVNASDYVGDWAFEDGAVVVTSCNDGSADATASLSDPSSAMNMTNTMAPSGIAALESIWLCDLFLNLDSAGAHLGTSNGPCVFGRQPGDPLTKPQSQTWITTKFELSVTKRDRGTATHVAEYTRTDVYTTTRVVTCHQVVHGDLQKL